MPEQTDLYTLVNDIITAFNETSTYSTSLVCFLDNLKRLVEIEASDNEKLHAIHAIINTSFYVNQSVYRMNLAAVRLAQYLGTTGQILPTFFQ